MIGTLKQEIKDAMVGKDSSRLKLLRMVMSEVQAVAITDRRKDITEDDLIKAVTSGISERKKAIEKFEKGIADIVEKHGSVDEKTQLKSNQNIDKLNSEIKVYQEFLPLQLTDEEVEVMVDEAITQVNAKSKKQMGQVMGLVRKKIPTGGYEMKKLSAMVMSKLN